MQKKRFEVVKGKSHGGVFNGYRGTAIKVTPGQVCLKLDGVAGNCNSYNGGYWFRKYNVKEVKNEPRTVWAIVGLPCLGYMYAKELIVIEEDDVNYTVAFGSDVMKVNKANTYSSEQETKEEIEKRRKK